MILDVPKMAAQWILHAFYMSMFARLYPVSSKAGSSAKAIVTDTIYGKVRGMESTSPYGDVIKFLGIPYALPPTGPRRFQQPYPPNKWTGDKDAFSFGPDCMQTDHYFQNNAKSEDCLYLNVFIPGNADISKGPLSVMVWLHGGGYLIGTGAHYDGSGLASQGVIVVTINYRLDVFGFLATEDDVIPGNFGMMDQIMALKWVKQNIASFGGDPNRVTIFGESAGSYSVSLLLLSPLAKGLFHRAIMESGSSLSPWAITHPATRTSPQLVTHLIGADVDCHERASDKLLQCLRGVDEGTLLNATIRLQSIINSPYFAMKPRVENIFGFLPDLPIRLLASGKINHVNTLHGFNADEMGYLVDSVQTIKEFSNFVSDTLKSFAFPDKNEFVQHVLSVYNISNTSDPYYIQNQALQMWTDQIAAGPISNELRMLVSNETLNTSNHYLYRFSYRPSYSKSPSWMSAVHSEEIQFVFGVDMFKNFGIDPNDTDRLVSDHVMMMWANFAKTGDPNSSPDYKDIIADEWKPFTISRDSMMDIDVTLNPTTFGLPDVTDLSFKLIQKLIMPSKLAAGFSDRLYIE